MVVVEEAENLQDPAYVYHQQQSAEALSKSITEEDEEEIESQQSSKDHALEQSEMMGIILVLLKHPFWQDSSRLKCQIKVNQFKFRGILEFVDNRSQGAGEQSHT